MSPRNVLLDALEACLLCDFGLSKVTHKGADGSHYYTHKGGSLPVRWMAPECFGQSKRYTAKTDVWSLGVVIWQLLTGQALPYHEVDDGMDVVVGLTVGSLDLRLSLPTAAIWATLTVLARQCLDRDPDQRPTAAQACARLRGSSSPPSAARNPPSTAVAFSGGGAGASSSSASSSSAAAAAASAAVVLKGAAGGTGAVVAVVQPVVAAPQGKVSARETSSEGERERERGTHIRTRTYIALA